MEWEGVRHQFQPDCSTLEKRFWVLRTPIFWVTVWSDHLFFVKKKNEKEKYTIIHLSKRITQIH